MIDIHNHILTAVDDGPKLIDESITIAKIAVEQGITVLFATPHVASRSELLVSREFPEKTAELQSALDDKHIDLRLMQGAEVYPTIDILRWLDDGYPLTLGPESKFILLDSPITQMTNGLDSLVFELQSRGYKPILAHPERVEPIQQNPALLEELVHRGLLLQINASSLCGRQGSESVKTAKILLDHNWVHFVASDSHSIRHRRPMLSEAYIELETLYGETAAKLLTEANGLKVLNNETVLTDPKPYQAKKKSWFARLLPNSR
ncbi:MAG: tyrosine-protein phosphatase [Armatimonadota bacterium]